MSKRIFGVLSILLVLSLMLAACGAPATEAPKPAAEEPAAVEPAAVEPAAEEPAAVEGIKVAILAPLSGQTSTFGESTKNGAQFAIDEWNAKGGVLGKQIVPIVEDSQCTPDPAVNAANKVIDLDKVKFIIGEVCSKASIPISVIAEAKGVIQVSPTSTSDLLTFNADGSVKKYVFRACYNDSFQGKVMATFAIGKGYKTAFIMLDKGNDYVLGLAENFEKAFTGMGGQVVGKETYTDKDTDFSPILTKVADSKAEMLFLPDYYPIVNLVGAQAKEKGVTAVMMGGDGWDSPDLDLAAAEGGFYSNHYSPEDMRPIVQDWVKNYKAKFNVVPDALATLAYDAANLLFSAIEKAGTADDTAAVADALAKIQLEGVSGKISFDENHNPVKAAAVLKVADGKVSYEETIAPDAGAAAPAEEKPAASGLPADTYIPVISNGFMHQFWVAVKVGTEKAAKDFGVTVTFEGPESESQVDKQLEMAQAALAKNPKAICLAAVDAKAFIPFLEEAKAKGIPVVAFDSAVDSDIPVAFAGTNNVAAAALAADKMAELIGGKGEVAIIAHDQTSGTGKDRVKGFTDQITSKYPDIKIVDTQYGGGEHLKSAEVAKAIIQAYPNLKGIFGSNEGSAIGAVLAVEEMKKEGLVIIGYDSAKSQIDAINNGLMAGAITQNPIGIGYKCVEAAVKTIKGETVEKNIDTGFFWYDKTNIDSPEIKPLLYE